MSSFIFDLQRFATTTITAGDSLELDGIIYAAIDDAVLNRDNEGKVSGIASGKVVATLEDNPDVQVAFDGRQAFEFSCSAEDDALGVTVQGKSIKFTSGEINYSADGVSASGEVSVTGAFKSILPFNLKLDIPDTGLNVTFDGETTITAPEKVDATLTFPKNIAEIVEGLKPLIAPLLQVDEDTANKIFDVLYKLVSSPTTAQLQGTVAWNQDDKKLIINKDSNIALNILDYDLSLTAKDGTVDGMFFFAQLTQDDAAVGVKFTPSTDQNAALQIKLDKDGSKICDGLINITSGSIDIDILNGKTSVEKDTCVTFTQDDSTFQFKFDDAATLTYSADEEGISQFTFGDNDGTVDLTLYRDDKEILKANVEINGTIKVDTENESIGVTKDTSAKVKINDYEATIDFTADTSITVSPKNDKFYITADESNDAFNFKIVRDKFTLFDGSFKIVGSIEFDTQVHSLSVSQGSTVTLTQDNIVTILKATNDAGLAFSVEGENITLTPNTNDGSLNITIKDADSTVFEGNLGVSDGSILFNPKTQSMSLTKGTTIDISVLNYEITATANDDAGVSFQMTNDGFEITPADNDGSLDIAIKRATEAGFVEIFKNTVSVSGGTITFNPTTHLMTLASGTTVSLSFDPYEVTAVADGDASSTISFANNGITVTPNTGDGKLKLTLGTKTGSMNADIEVLSGSFTLGEGGTLTVAKDTELEIKFSDDYIINFKATNAAGGSISLGTDGITFAPNSNDGGLELTVKRGKDTRTASLDVTGSVTYKLDGSISLTKGTVVKNVFDDGNILTITANTDANGTINFNPQTGLTIKPATPDAMTATLTTGDLQVAQFSSITGSITYSGGIVTATNGTQANLLVYDTWATKLGTKGGTASLQFTDDRTVYTANDGATFTLEYVDDGTTLEIQNGSFTDIYATETSDAIELVSVGSTFKANDEEFVFTLEKAGNYTLNGVDVTTSADNVQVVLSGDYDTVTFAADAGITVSASGDSGFRFGLVDSDGNIKVTSTESGDFGVSSGSITFGAEEFSISKGTIISLARGEQTTTLTVTEDISAPLNYDDKENIYYLNFDAITADFAVTQDEQTILSGDLEIDGVFSYNPNGGTFGLTGANSSHGDGSNTSLQFNSATGLGVKLATNDTTVVFVPKFADGKLEFNFPNERKDEMLLTLSRDGQTIFENQVTINGTVGFDTAKQELSLTKDTVLTLKQGDNNLEITALDNAGGNLTFVEGGIRFAPNTGDGQLELNFVSANRKANIDVTGAVVLGKNGKISLEDGTEVNFTWDDGTELKLTSKGSTGSIGLDEKGIKITSEDKNLTIDLKTADGTQTTVSDIQGTIYYREGSVIIEEGTSLTGTGTIGAQPVDITLEAQGGDGSLNFGATGMTYAAGTGALKVTLARDGAESTFVVNEGSVQIAHSLFTIAEGTDFATDLKDFIPAINFKTSEAGNYTINGQTITTYAEGLALTATDDYITFKTSDDVVTYDEMTFTGNGSVSLRPDNVALGAGVIANGFGEGKSFMLAEAGNVSVDAKVFEVDSLKNKLDEDIPLNVSVEGSEDGFTFSREITRESEDYFDDPDYTNVGKIFREEFHSSGDDSYRIQTDPTGLQKIIGISDGATITADAELDGKETYSIFDVVTDREGTYTVVDKPYSISGDSDVAIKARFEDGQASVAALNDLDGTISGDFTAHEVSVNGSSSAVQPVDDTLISISADDNGFEISGLDEDSSLLVKATDLYVVNGTSINANAGDYIVGADDSAYLMAVNDDTLIIGTEQADYIFNTGENVSIQALGGDDTISNTGENVTINAGTGDDVISLSGGSALINYADGDGNDSVYGFDYGSTLSVGDNAYATQISGDDLIITVGTGKITLVNAADLIDPNIETTNDAANLIEVLLKRTILGYPIASGVLLNPEEVVGEEPDDYAVKEDWSITSADNLKLHGVCYMPENSNDKWVVLIHGYGLKLESMYPFTHFYLDNGYNVLMIDQRAAGESEGIWLTMGAAESQDVALWTQEIANRYPDSKITLHGVSMGSATAMLAASRADAVNVTSLIEDCGYTDTIRLFNVLNDVFKDVLNERFKAFGIEEINPEVIAALDSVGYGMTGYYLHDASPINSISSAKMPTLFIHGDDDGVVPVSMVSELYDASGAEVKEKFIVKGAGHAQSGLKDLDGYRNTVFRFVAEANGEGWETENDTAEISLRGTKYNDTIANSGDYVTVDGEAGDDYIENTADNVSIFGGADNDTIYNHGDNLTLDGGAGDDSISNNSANVVFVYSGGNDTIDGFKEDSTLSIGGDYTAQIDGSDVIVNVGDNKILLVGASALDYLEIVGSDGSTIENYNSDSLISGTSGNDSITNYGRNVTISTYGGRDTIDNYGDNASIDGGSGADSIRNEHAYNVTINGGSGSDKIIVVTGDHTTIDGGDGKDTIIGATLEGGSSTWAMGGYSNIDGGTGDDYINPIFSDSASILGGAGNDTIINEGNDATLNGGAGDDIISLHGASLESDVIKYDSGDGNDTIYGFNDTSKLSITAGTNYTKVASGEDVIVNVGENKITIAGGAELSTLNIINYEVPALNVTNTADNTLITGTELADTIANSGDKVTIKSVSGDDSIRSSGANNSINGGAGNDIIENGGANSTVVGDYGNDTINNSGDYVTINGGHGNDTLINSGDYVTINGSTGYNYFENTGDNVQFKFEGGLDTINGFKENSTLSIAADTYETLEGIKNVVVSNGNADIVVLKDAFLNDNTININGTTIELSKVIEMPVYEDNDFTIGRNNVSIVSGTGDDVISLTSAATNDVIIYGGGNDTIYGFNDTTRLSISGEYSSIKVGDDVIFKVGTDSIKVVDGGNVIATNFEDGESILLTEKGAVTVDGKTFELTKKVPSGVTITGIQNGFTSAITDDDGKIFVEEFKAAGDEEYQVRINGDGLQTISGIDAGADVSLSATEDGATVENKVAVVTEDAGTYTFNDMKFTLVKANAEINLYNDAIGFTAEDVVYDGKTFGGDGKVSVSSDSVILGANVTATGFENDKFVLKEKGTATVDGKTIELTEKISDGMTLESANDGYTLSHVITQKEASQNSMPSSYIGKVFSEKVLVEGDDTYSLQADTFGLRRVSGITDGATIGGGGANIDGKTYEQGQYFYVDTDTEGEFTIGDKVYSISGDTNVEIVAEFLPEKSYASGFNNLTGTVSGSLSDEAFTVNGGGAILISGDDNFEVVGISGGAKLLDISDGATLARLGGVKEVHTDTEGVFQFGAESVAISVIGDDSVTFKLSDELITEITDVEGDLMFSDTYGDLYINGMSGTFYGEFTSIGAYDNTLYIHDVSDGAAFTTNNADKIWLEMIGDTFTLNGNELTLTNDSDGIWLRDKEIVGLDENASLQVSKGGTYTANETELKAKSGDVIIGLKNDAYIYDADNPLITRHTSTADIIKAFKPARTEEINSGKDVTLNGGELAIVESAAGLVNIAAGDDTIVSRGENVNVSLTGGNTWLFPLEGKMTLTGYDESTGTGFGTTYTNILSAVENGLIDFENGVLNLDGAQVEVGSSSELMNFFDRGGRRQKVGYASQNDMLDVSGKTDDLLLVAKKNSSIISGIGDDTILAQGGNYVDGGKGSNLVRMTGEGNSNIVLSGRTTVEGFHTGFGTGTDTIYIAGDPAGVDFKSGGLTFGNSVDTVTLSDVNTTAKVNIFHERRNVLNKGVFIAPGDWYTVEDSDLAVSAGEEVYFVGTAAKPKVGIDFSGITSDLNVTMDTAYVDSPDYVPTTMWINSVYSLIGGSGNTTIIGSDKNDTILAGSGEQNIYGGAGHDKMFGNATADKQVATFYYTAGDGRDSIENFDFMTNAQDVTADKIQLDDNSNISEVLLRGDDVMIKVDGADGFLMLEGAKGKSFRVNDDLIAKVDTNVEFDGFSNCYAGIGERATLTVGKGLGNVEVWLSDDSLEYHGTMYDGKFEVVDASQTDGTNILAGNELGNVIMGGSGANSLWGGYGSENDTLIGGAGQNSFFYLQGNGRDVVRNAHDGDEVILDDITLEQIAEANITAGGVVINFTDGGSLTVEGTAEVTYQLADGSRHVANRATNDWNSK